MSSTSVPFPQPRAYCKEKQCTCEYANVFGYCVCSYCVKSTAEKAEYITNTILNGGDANDRKQSCTISDDVGRAVGRIKGDKDG